MALPESPYLIYTKLPTSLSFNTASCNAADCPDPVMPTIVYTRDAVYVKNV
jgi:hypothetical protein